MRATQFQPRPRVTFIFLGVVWSLFVLMFGATEYMKNHRQGLSDRTKIVIKLFDLDASAAIPQAYQALGLFVISALSFVIARNRKAAGDKLSIYWKALAVIFLFLTFDGLCNIHNQFHVHNYTPEQEAERDKQGLFYYSWTMVYGAALIPVGLWFLRFLFKLPRKFGVLILCAGVIFVMVALGMEMVSGLIISRGHGHERNDVNMIMVTLEESMEMLGEMLMIYACLWYMAENRIESLISPQADAVGANLSRQGQAAGVSDNPSGTR